MSDTVVTSWWESKLVRRLDVVAAVGAILLLCRVVVGEDLAWTAWVMVGILAVALAATRWPYGALVVLVGMSAMPRFFVEVFGWKARPEHFAVVIVSLAAGAWLLGCHSKLRLENLDFWVLAYIAINYVSSAFGSSSPSDTLRWALLNNLAVLTYFLVRLLVREPETLRKALYIFLSVGVLESAYGILCHVSHHILGTTAGMEIGQYFTDVAAPYGSLYEPNLFGAYAACCAVTFLGLCLVRRRGRPLFLACFGVTSLAALASLSRAALFALVAAIGWLFWKARRFKSDRGQKPYVLGFAVILLVGILGIGGILKERFGNLFQQGLADETTITRFVVVQEALQEIPKHLLLGNGTASFQLSFDWVKYVPNWAGNPTWVGNVTIRILHDTGLLGFTAFLGFVISLSLKIRRGLLQWSSHVPMLLGLSGGAFLYAISFQSTDGTTLAFCWVHLGLLASAAVLVNSQKHDLSAAGDASNRSAKL